MAANASASGPVAPPQAGVLEGSNPIAYTPSNPISLFIVQAIIVILLCQLLHYPLRLLNQPRVIAEVIGGILLGPSVMMRIPGFKDTIFPTASMPVFNNVANLGLLIFLFLIALEVDIRLFTHNWRAALSVGLAGMALPFGLGFAIAWGIYNQLLAGVGTPISFGVFGLFIGTALAITAFPVLCRILSELNLLRSNVGVTVLAAGIGNDVTGWILLALCVALVNNSSGLAALWALLCCIGWALFLVFIVRPPFIWVLGRTGSLHNGPTQGMVALTMLMMLASAWFTGIIGVHPIFGAFLMGLICPHDGGFAIKLTEKIEDLISVLFNPLYFALSGLNTNLGLLNDGVIWGYVIGIIVCAFFGKIAGGTLAARANKLLWRESFTIGCLMSCKGLVELIVLNIGLQAGILSETTFTMFVVMALVTTVATTPLTKALYPPWYQQKVDKWRRGEIDWDGNPIDPSETGSGEPSQKAVESQIRRLMVHLRLDSLPSLFTFINLLGPEAPPAPIHPDAAETSPKESEVQIKKRPLEVHGLRLIELTDRTSSVMHLTEGEDFYSLRDPVVNAFRTFSQLHDVAVSGRVAVVPTDSYAETIMTQASEVASDFALIPWGEYGSVSEDQSFPIAMSASERFRSSSHLDFMNRTLSKAARTCNVGIFIDNGFGGLSKPADRPALVRRRSIISIRSHRAEPAALPVADKSHHIFLPFFGGPDDRVALRLVLQLARNPHVTASIVYIHSRAEPGPSNPPEGDSNASPATTTTPSSSSTDPNPNHKTGPTATTTTAVDEPPHPHPPARAEGQQAPPPPSRAEQRQQQEEEEHDAAFFETMHASLPAALAPRVVFSELLLPPPSSPSSSAALTEVLLLAQQTVGQRPKNAGDVVVLGRWNARFGFGYGDGAAGGAGAGVSDGGSGGGGLGSNSGNTGAGGGTGGGGSSGGGGGGSGGGAGGSLSSGNNPDLKRVIGPVGERLVTAGVRASVLVVQAGGKGADGYA